MTTEQIYEHITERLNKELKKDPSNAMNKRAVIDGMIGQAKREGAMEALALLGERDAEIERLNKEVDRLSQVVLYHDGRMVDTIKEFTERAYDELRTGNIIMDKSIADIINNIANEMLEELK